MKVLNYDGLQALISSIKNYISWEISAAPPSEWIVSMAQHDGRLMAECNPGMAYWTSSEEKVAERAELLTEPFEISESEQLFAPTNKYDLKKLYSLPVCQSNRWEYGCAYFTGLTYVSPTLFCGANANVLDVSYFFRGCTGISSISIDNNALQKCEIFNRMFAGTNALNMSGFTHVDLPNFLPSSIRLTGMFEYCNITQALFTNTTFGPNTLNMGYFFNGCTKLTTAALKVPPSLVNASMMFYNCVELVQFVALSGSSFGNVTAFTDSFYNCPKLQMLVLPDLKVSFSLAQSPNISAQNVRALINSLANVAYMGENSTLTLHPFVKARLTSSDLATASAKGWTIA